MTVVLTPPPPGPPPARAHHLISSLHSSVGGSEMSHEVRPPPASMGAIEADSWKRRHSPCPEVRDCSDPCSSTMLSRQAPQAQSSRWQSGRRVIPLVIQSLYAVDSTLSSFMFHAPRESYSFYLWLCGKLWHPRLGPCQAGPHWHRSVPGPCPKRGSARCLALSSGQRAMQ